LPGSIILAGVLLKVGGYGMMKFFIPNFPLFISSYNHIFMCLSITGIVYTSLIAIKQTDFKRLIAYSSISHMGFVMLGLFSLSVKGIEGSFCLMVAHGLSSSSMFILVTILYQRFGSRTIKYYCGLITGMPLFSSIFMLVTLISTSFPLTLNFCGEILILIGTLSSNLGIFLIISLVIGIVLGSVYSFLLYNSLINGRINKISIGAKDLNRTEFSCLIFLTIPNICLGVFPYILINDNLLNFIQTAIYL
jgi:NADH:ubiquinone oxidoreductase subunit 4 (subunit M)